MRTTIFILVVMLMVAPISAKADMVLDWNENALDAIRVDKTATPMVSRALAILHTAIYDAVNSIYKSYTPYKFQLSNYTTASPEAAVASAGYTVLKGLYPNQCQTFLNQYNESIASLTPGFATNLGIKLGQKVAQSMLQLRQNDGWNAVSTYTPTSEVGRWQPTPTNFAAFLLPEWYKVTPFTMTSGNQFRQAAPPALDSCEYAKDLNEVKSLGAKNSTTRTCDQTNIADFWVYGSGTVTPPGHWNEIAQNVAKSESNTLAENARMFALLNLGLADAGITAWDMKRSYDLWRPITGIRNAGEDGNPDTKGDPDWEPLAATPNFPSYVSGHSTFSGAAAALLAEFFEDDNIAFSSTSDSSGKTRYFDSFSEAAEESGRSRIYCGIHYEFDNVNGLTAGQDVGEYVFANFLSPVPLPGTLSLSLVGLSAMLLSARRRQAGRN